MSLESMRAMVGRMDGGERELLLEALLEAVDAELPVGGGAPRPGACPRCGCGRVRGHGRDARGRRRWVCLGCGRTFGATTGTVLGRSRLDRVTWHAYAGAMLAGASLRACASVAGVSLRTSFFMRHRLCEVMARTTPALRARRGCRVLVDGLAFPDSLSGNHSRSAAGFSMPRPPRRRGGDGVTRGLGGDKVCVAVAVDERGGTRVAAVGRRRGTAAGWRAFLVSCGVRRGCVLVSDLDQLMPVAALGTGASNERHPSTDRAALNRVNAACSALRHWLARFRGVSTRRLANYLAWYQWSLDARRTDSPADLLADQADRPTELTGWRAYASTPYPFHPELDAFTSTVG